MNPYIQERRPAGVRALRLATVAILTIWAASATARADDNPPKAAPGGAAAVNQQSAEAVTAQAQAPASQPARRPLIQPLQSGTTPAKQSGCSDKGSPTVPTPSPDGPQPRWVCKQQTVTADPVWAGTKAEFVFEIANEGEADLQIKLKGG